MEPVSIRIKRLFLAVRRRLVAVAFGLILAAALAVAAANIFGAVRPPLPIRDFTTYKSGDPFWTPDDWLGLRMNPNEHLVHKKYLRQRLFASAVYHTGPTGWRVTIQEPLDEAQSFAMFAPCSFTFGEGVNDGETLPSQFARQVVGKRVAVYNYGVSSWGPNNLLALLTDPRRPAGIREKRGFLVYSFIDEHIDRAVLRRSFLENNTLVRHPYYGLAADNRVRRFGLVDAAHPPYATWQYKVLNRLGLIGTLFEDWPIRNAEKDQEFTARIIGACATEFRRLFDAQGVFLIFFPSCKAVKTMTPLLERQGIRCLDYTEAMQFDVHTESAYFFPDGHPTAAADRLVAEMLANNLEQMGVIR